MTEHPKGLPDAGTMPAEPLTAERPDCHLCTWVIVSHSPPVWRIKMLSASCEVHASVKPARWSAEQYRAGLPSLERAQPQGYSRPAEFLREIDERRSADAMAWA